MQKIYLSDSGPKVSGAIYGFFRWNFEINNTAEAMEKIINLCLDLGINTFDHADVYGSYHCEELFGKQWIANLLKERTSFYFQNAA